MAGDKSEFSLYQALVDRFQSLEASHERLREQFDELVQENNKIIKNKEVDDDMVGSNLDSRWVCKEISWKFVCLWTLFIGWPCLVVNYTVSVLLWFRWNNYGENKPSGHYSPSACCQAKSTVGMCFEFFYIIIINEFQFNICGYLFILLLINFIFYVEFFICFHMCLSFSFYLILLLYLELIFFWVFGLISIFILILFS